MERRIDAESAGLAAQQLAEATAWILGPEGKARARRTLTRLGLSASPYDVDDLSSAALERLAVRFGSGPIDLERGVDSVRAYATTVLRRTAARWLDRGARERLVELVDWSDSRAVPLASSDDEAVDLTEELGVGDAVDGARVHSLGAIDGRVQAWTVAAALATLTCRNPDVTIGDDVRVPADETDLPRWAGLSYAGRSDCFDMPETGAVRERRSQALRQVSRLLARLLDASTRAGTEVSP